MFSSGVCCLIWGCGGGTIRRWSGDKKQKSHLVGNILIWKSRSDYDSRSILQVYLLAKSCRSRRTHTSPVGTSCSRRRRVTGPLFSNSFLMVATGTSVRPRNSKRKKTFWSREKRKWDSGVCVELQEQEGENEGFFFHIHIIQISLS